MGADLLLLAQRLPLALRATPSAPGAHRLIFEDTPGKRCLAAGALLQRHVAKPDAGKRTRIGDGCQFEILEAALSPSTRVEPSNVCKGESFEDFKQPVRLLEDGQGVGIAEQRQCPGCAGCPGCIEGRADMVGESYETGLGTLPVLQVERCGGS